MRIPIYLGIKCQKACLFKTHSLRVINRIVRMTQISFRS